MCKKHNSCAVLASTSGYGSIFKIHLETDFSKIICLFKLKFITLNVFCHACTVWNFKISRHVGVSIMQVWFENAYPLFLGSFFEEGVNMNGNFCIFISMLASYKSNSIRTGFTIYCRDVSLQWGDKNIKFTFTRE